MPHDHQYYRSIAALLSGVVPDLPPSGWDWDKWIRTATEESVLPALHACAPPSFPAEILDFLDAIQRLNGERNAQLLSEIASHVRLLSTVGIEPVLLKGGAYLLNGVYSCPARRFISDIDFLIAENDLQTANSLFENAGYQADLSDPVRETRHHLPPLVKPSCYKVELHHALTTGRARHLLPASEVIAASEPLEIDGAIVRLPSAEHLMTHLIIHSQVHHLYVERIWPTLRSMYDLLLIERRFGPAVNWPSIEDRFRRFGVFGLLAAHLRQVESTLRLESPVRHNGAWAELRWLHRRALWRLPALRFIDPWYIYSLVVAPNIELSRDLMNYPGGLSYILRTPFRLSFYRKLVNGFVSR